MKKETTLNDKIELINRERGDRYHPMIDVKDAKQFIQEFLDEVKENRMVVTPREHAIIHILQGDIKPYGGGKKKVIREETKNENNRNN